MDGFRARRAIDRLAVSQVLEGVRGGDPVDVDGLIDTVVRFSEMAADSVGTYSSIDINPVIVGPDYAVAVDVLMIPAS